MKARDWLFWLVTLITVGTVIAGLAQLILPHMVLGIIGAQQTSETQYLFAIVGMFMAIIGGMTLHALFDTANHPIVILWAAIQKLGASTEVGIGVAWGHFGTLAFGIAAFDLFSGIVFLAYLMRIRGRTR
jgi:hypothetical protein